MRKKGATETPQETQGAPQADDKPKAKVKTAGSGKRAAKKPTAAKKGRKGVGGRTRLYVKLKISAMLNTVTGWASEGATMSEIAEVLGVAESTVYKWQKEEPEFAEALRAGRHVSNGELIASAMRQSMGGKHTVRKAIKTKDWELKKDPDDPDDPGQWMQVDKVVIAEEDYFVEPNAQITMFMLANRMPTRYKKQHHIEHGGSVGANYDHMTDEQLAAEIAALESYDDKPQRRPSGPTH